MRNFLGRLLCLFGWHSYGVEGRVATLGAVAELLQCRRCYHRDVRVHDAPP